MLKRKMEVDNAVQFASQNKTKTEEPSFDLTGLIIGGILAAGLVSLLVGALQNGRTADAQQNQLIRELIKERGK